MQHSLVAVRACYRTTTMLQIMLRTTRHLASFIHSRGRCDRVFKGCRCRASATGSRQPCARGPKQTHVSTVCSTVCQNINRTGIFRQRVEGSRALVLIPDRTCVLTDRRGITIIHSDAALPRGCARLLQDDNDAPDNASDDASSRILHSFPRALRPSASGARRRSEVGDQCRPSLKP